MTKVPEAVSVAVAAAAARLRERAFDLRPDEDLSASIAANADARRSVCARLRCSARTGTGRQVAGPVRAGECHRHRDSHRRIHAQSSLHSPSRIQAAGGEGSGATSAPAGAQKLASILFALSSRLAVPSLRCGILHDRSGGAHQLESRAEFTGSSFPSAERWCSSGSSRTAACEIVSAAARPSVRVS